MDLGSMIFPWKKTSGKSIRKLSKFYLFMKRKKLLHEENAISTKKSYKTFKCFRENSREKKRRLQLLCLPFFWVEIRKEQFELGNKACLSLFPLFFNFFSFCCDFIDWSIWVCFFFNFPKCDYRICRREKLEIKCNRNRSESLGMCKLVL